MKNNYEISRLIDGEKYASKESPDLSDIVSYLKVLERKGGCVRLTILNAKDIGPERLSVEADDGFYLITLLEYDDNDSNVRSYSIHPKSEREILIRGYYWPENQLTTNFDLVVDIFKEFFETGNVSIERLN